MLDVGSNYVGSNYVGFNDVGFNGGAVTLDSQGREPLVRIARQTMNGGAVALAPY